MQNPHRLAEALELADILRPSWPEMQRKLRESGVPLNDEPTTETDPPPVTDPPKTETDPPPSTDPPKTEPEPDPVKGENERLKREVAKFAQEKRERERKEAEASGDHAKVVQQLETEGTEKDTEIADLKAQLAKRDHDSEVRKVAESLNFHDSEDALLRVPTEIADKGEAAIQKHLKGIAEKSPHLVGEGPKRSSAPVTDPENGGGGGEVEQLSSTEGMSTEAIAKALKEGRLRDYLKSK